MGNESWGDRTRIYSMIADVMKRLDLEAPMYGITDNHQALVMILNGFEECERRLQILTGPDLTKGRP